MSRIGKKPVAIPSGVKAEVKDSQLSIEGPKGKSTLSIHSRVNVEIKDNQLIVNRFADAKPDRAMHGLFRALIFNMVKGVTEGYKKELEIIGVGFKANVQGKNLTMQLGFSHPVIIAVPEGIKIETPKATQIVITGIDKQLVGKTASSIRAVFPPEPYKGKGIRYAGEYIKKKIGKAQATSK